jgi:hypothetical protein
VKKRSSESPRHRSEYIHTYTGKAIYPEEMTVEDVCLEDIAHGLGGIYRFNGQSRVSVLRHSIAVGLHFPDGSAERLWGWLHDAAEAYMMDVPKPLQRLIGEEWRIAYHHVEGVILEAFGLRGCGGDSRAVKGVDDYVVEYEMDIGMRRHNSRMAWPLARHLKPIDIARLDELYYMWHMSEEELGHWFIARVESLSANLRGGCAQTSTSQGLQELFGQSDFARTALEYASRHGYPLSRTSES